MIEIKKAIIPVAGLGTRFLPLSKVLPKELWPLADIPIIQYIVEEAAASGIKEIIFVTKPEKKLVLDYFQKKLKSKKNLKARYKNHFLKKLESLERISKNVSFSQVFQKESLGDGHALLQARRLIGNEPCAVLWSDDVIESKIPCLLQLIKVFKKYQKPIIALSKVPKESFQFYGMIKGEKTADREYLIKKIVEKPSTIKESPSNLAAVGKYILTPEVFEWLEKARLNKDKELLTNKVLNKSVINGKEVYGYEFEGKWLECGNKLAYLKSNFYLSLKSPEFGKELARTWRNWNTR